VSQLHRPEPTGGPRRHLRRLGAALTALGLFVTLFAAAGAGGAVASRRTIDVIQVEGLIDPPNAQLIVDAVHAANHDRSQILVITINSGGAVNVDAQRVLRAVRRSRVPVVSWIGPSGSKARGLAAALGLDSAVVAVSNGSSIGPLAPLLLDSSDAPSRAVVARRLSVLLRGDRRTGHRVLPVIRESLGSEAAVAKGVTDAVCADPPGCATLGDFVVALDGKTLPTAAGPVRVDTAKVVGTGQDRRRQPDLNIRFRKLDLVGQAVHTLTSPSIAYGLLVVGLALIIFEFFTISIGLAGGTGAIALVGAFVGFDNLPVTWWALALIFVAMFGYAIDVQAGRAYSWTVIATILLVIGTLFLYGGSPVLNVYWWVIVVIVVATVVFFVTAMPVAVRSRFSTPTIGRESLVGEMGEAAVDIAPDGVVILRGAHWRARTNRATPIAAGAPIRVVEVDGLVLEVEPPEGGARDYREPRKKATPDPDPGTDS
jgi:membrane-bound serine protease (ClpP class)